MGRIERQRKQDTQQVGLLGRYLRGTLFMMGSFALLAAFLTLTR